MQVCLVTTLPELGVGLQLDGAGSTEWQAPKSKTHALGWSGVIKTGVAGSVNIWLGGV